MKDYNKMYETAQKGENLHRLTPRRIKFNEGDLIVGEYQGRTELESTKKGMPNFFVYVFDTDDGPVQFPISQAFDKQDGERLVRGGIYALKHGGYQALDEKRRVKIVDVDVIEEPEAGEEESL